MIERVEFWCTMDIFFVWMQNIYWEVCSGKYRIYIVHIRPEPLLSRQYLYSYSSCIAHTLKHYVLINIRTNVNTCPLKNGNEASLLLNNQYTRSYKKNKTKKSTKKQKKRNKPEDLFNSKVYRKVIQHIG